MMRLTANRQNQLAKLLSQKFDLPETVLQGSAGRTHDAPGWPQSYAVRTYFGRPRSSMRFSAPTAMATSVARRRSVRERNPSPITRLNRLTSDSTRARQL